MRVAGDAVYLRRQDGDGDGAWWAFSADASGALTFALGGPPDDAGATLHADALFGAFRLLAGDYIAVVTKSRRIARAPTGGGFIHQVRRRSADAAERRRARICAPPHRRAR